MSVRIDWKAPPPRSGALGFIDQFLGPGASRAELVLQTVPVVVGAIAAPLYASRVVEDWSVVQYAVCAVLAFDVAGGILTNATSSARRWYHRAGQGAPEHLGFVALHLIHLVLVSWLYLGFDLGWLVPAAGYLLVAAAVVLSVPLYLQRPVAFGCYAGALLVSIYLLRQPVGLEWFLPLFYFKLLVSHLPREEPYRPAEREWDG